MRSGFPVPAYMRGFPALLRKAGARVSRAAFVIGLPDLGGSKRLADEAVDVRALMEFAGD